MEEHGTLSSLTAVGDLVDDEAAGYKVSYVVRKLLPNGQMPRYLAEEMHRVVTDFSLPAYCGSARNTILFGETESDHIVGGALAVFDVSDDENSFQ